MNLRALFGLSVTMLLLGNGCPVQALLLEQDFTGSITHITSTKPTNPLGARVGEPVSGFVIYVGATGSEPPTPGVQLSDGVEISFGESSYHCGDFWNIPCRTTPNGPGQVFFDARGHLTGIDVAIPVGLTEFTLVVAGDQFVVPPGPDDPPCDSTSVVCGTLDFSNSTPRSVSTPRSLTLVGVALAILALVVLFSRSSLRYQLFRVGGG